MKKIFLLAALCALGFGIVVYAGETQEPARVVSQEDPGEQIKELLPEGI